MEDLLTEWLLENRPYTKLNIRIKHFIQYCKKIQPELFMQNTYIKYHYKHNLTVIINPY